MSLEQLAVGHPEAERQLEALRAIARVFEEDAPHFGSRRRCTGCSLLRELDAADRAAGEVANG